MDLITKKINHTIAKKAELVELLELQGNPTWDAIITAVRSGGGSTLRAKMNSILDRSITELTADDLSGLTQIKNYLFYGCSYLQNVDIPESVVVIGEHSFENCGVVSVKLKEGLKWIKQYSFKDCNALTTICLPSSIETLSNYMFDGCSNLGNAYYNGSLEQWCSVVLGTIDSNPAKKFQNFYFLDNNGNISYDNKKYSILTSIVIPNSITKILDATFQGWTFLQSVSFHQSVTEIGRFTFADCTSLVINTIPENITKIGDNAFKNTAITSITISSTVTTIGYGIFQDCANLTSVNIQNSSISSDEFKGCVNLTNVTISNNTTSIGSSAFSGCTSLTEIAIPNSVISFMGNIFYNCTSLVKMTIPTTYSISLNTTVKNVVINDGSTSIQGQYFRQCSSLESVTLPASITSIGSLAFISCHTDLTITYKGTQLQWSSITKEQNWNYIDQSHSITTIHCKDGDITL